MYLLVNIIGVLVFLGIAFLFSKDHKHVNWRSVLIVLVLNLVVAYLLTNFSLGRDLVKSVAEGFQWLVNVSYTGIAFAFPDWVHVKQMNFFTAALMPILMIVPLFDILTYFGIMPFCIKWIGRGMAFVTGQPKFESFYAVEMMFLGNTEAMAVSSLQLKNISAKRVLTISMMSMSCITAAMVGAYAQMVPGQYVLTAIPLNILNAIIITNLLNPVRVSPDEDVIYQFGGSSAADEQIAEETVADRPEKPHKEPFFSFLGDSILGAGKLILIIVANVIAFVALAALISKLLGLINPWLSLEHILGTIMFPFAWLMGLDVNHAFQFAQYMGTKLVTNEFVVMGEIAPHINNHHFFSPHYQAQLTVFLTSFANFSTVGMIVGCLKGIVSREKNDFISKNIVYLFLSGILVSLMSAGIVGLFVW
ncbi:NupC/NupG family nucleoside CNT transporter [Fructilactobacillus ixorae]|uniref:NupC/NupG family nucleoside CNT transporter n=1 Tax=Fructilactobacillus ixorae TaxID=1750535 RepID=A0ABY5C4I5_9LACO|nr:nucleoside transporter C-terminal domain-containing protein [Fructilactobacillus ixorae]USS93492.1 NupC/NupG family nucleoside CNT transporter [Fructilactobacillus ixorae]